MTPEEEIEALELEAELRRRGKSAAPAPSPAAEAEKAVAKRGIGEGSFATGLKQGSTLSLGDELAGLAGAAGALWGDATISEAPAYYREARDEERRRLEESRKADPLLTGAGQVAGSLLLPGGAAAGAARGGLGAAALQGAKVGAATGAATGVGEAESLSPQDVVLPVLGGAMFGGLAGAAAPIVSAAAKPLMGVIRRPLAKAGEQADELRVLTSAGATGGSINAPRVLQEAKRVPGGIPEAARVLRESGISRGVTTTSGVLKRAQAAQEKSGQAIGDILERADEWKISGQVDARALAANLRAQADEALAGVGGISDVTRQNAAALQKLAERIEQAAPEGRISPLEAKRLSVQLGSDAGEAYLARAMGRPVSGKAEALMSTRRATEEGIDRAVEGAGLSSQAYREARRLNQVSRLAGEAAETSLGRQSKNNLLGLTDATLLAGGAPGAGMAAARKALTPISAGLRATGAETAESAAKALGRMIEAPPSGALGRSAGALYGASTGAMEDPVSVAGTGYTDADQALAADLLSRGMSPEEVASILGPPQTSMDRPVLRARPSAAR